MEFLRRLKPEEQLLNYVRENDEVKMEKLLRRKPKLIRHRYKKCDGKTIFAIACESSSSNIVQILLNYGADKVKCNSDGYEAIHFAVLGNCPNVIRTVIKSGCEINATTLAGDSALHILIRNNKSNHLLECAEILLNNGLDLNIVNNKFQTALFLAARSKQLELVKLLLQADFVDLDTCIKCYVQCKCCWISATGVPVRELVENLNISTENVARYSVNNELCERLNARDEEGFVNLVVGLDVIYYYNHFVKVACIHNYNKVIQYFLYRGVDAKMKGMQHIQPPSNVAAKYGLHQALQFTINYQYVPNKKEILFDIFTPEVPHRKYIPSSDYKKCQNIIINQTNTNYNVRDDRRNYLLMYTSSLEAEQILGILKAGASLGNRNSDGSLTLSKVDFQILQHHFNWCINSSYKTSHYITFFYECLLPTRCRRNCVNYGGTEFLHSETEVVLHISRKQYLRPLLKHPMIKTFLIVKWQKMKLLFYTNLVLYVMFLVLLLYYLFDQSRDDAQMSTVTTSILLLTTVGVVCRELTQFSMNPGKHFKSVENVIQLAIIAVVLFVAIKQDIPLDARKQICAFTTVLVSFDVLYLLGNHPVFSTNIAMFRRISLEYAKFLLFFSVPIIGFGLCFYILFHDSPLFDNPPNSLFKTLLMLTGEFEAGSLDFQTHATSSHVLLLLFVFTIVIILMNLLNGLAVSDVQKVVEEAELIGLAAIAEYISYLEYVILGNSINRKYFSKRPNFISKHVLKPLAYMICMYPKSDGNFKIRVNQQRKMAILNLTLEKKIFKEAEDIALKNKQKKTFVRKDSFRKQVTLEDVNENVLGLKMQLEEQAEELECLRAEAMEREDKYNKLLGKVLKHLDNINK